MIKNAIAPIQAWLLSQGRCVGCGMPLDKGASVKSKNGTKVTCQCRRVYVRDSKGIYRRALIDEV
ncbi:hypothetical protein A2801_00685 [Candidatus Woesebacteria bacterium RIFCSPHIGHO2_01_FULL_41_10]|uniref:Uncharacterized protein n=1 Tax=Candidatus Woesebacteria bacterium RIFCSPHIGHO2_01_FULL_41_10 TaxID=1802500 RepID=A0A1F7YN65_9BACT|nr:MAG: hypothetical protein A2801_00685 [Candidatus Woesebacteria bacterium RIFCSPHIGHO2_01_FULL_41_10]